MSFVGLRKEQGGRSCFRVVKNVWKKLEICSVQVYCDAVFL